MERHWLGQDPLLFAIVDAVSGRALGMAGYLRIDPANGSIEVGHLAYAPSLQRSPAATEAMYLLMAHAIGLGYRRYEWKCNSLNEPSRAARLHLRGTLPSGRGREGPQPRHRVVFAAGFGMGRRQSRV
jgi:RimJ/RimL family protein N-acetyltransferase